MSTTKAKPANAAAVKASPAKAAAAKNSAFNKPVTVSAALAKIVGAGPMARTEVTKKLWEYIKKNQRQDTTDKRNIVPDEHLKAVFGTSSAVNMFKMTSLVAAHISG